jgi:hypothetical protein
MLMGCSSTLGTGILALTLISILFACRSVAWKRANRLDGKVTPQYTM